MKRTSQYHRHLVGTLVEEAVDQVGQIHTQRLKQQRLCFMKMSSWLG